MPLITSLSPLPVAALRINDDIVQSLHHLGIDTIGQLADLPRTSLPARFGKIILTRLDQALGRLAEPLVPLLFHAPIHTSKEFDGPIASLEGAWLVLKHLLADVTAELRRRSAGARTLVLTLSRPYGPPWSKTVDLLRPSHDPAELFALLRCALDTLPGQLDDEWWAMSLRITSWQRMTFDQATLLGEREHETSRDLALLVSRLHTRLGDHALDLPELVESHAPERAWRPADPTLDTAAGALAAPPPSSRRPIRIFQSPAEVPVMVTPSEDREDGRPVLFQYHGGTRHITHTVGPERIAGLWWEGRSKTRDYFEVEDEHAARWWLFRVPENNRWFLHGIFE